MNGDLLDFLNGDKNSLKYDFIISREKMPNGVEHIYIKTDDLNTCLFDFYVSPKKKRSKNEEPKHTGGKKPYVMIMVEAIRELKGNDIDSALGSAVMLADNIQWNTGLIINKRTKKPLLYEDLKKIYSCGDNKLTKKIKVMKELGILLKDKEGYKISPKFIKKGGVKV